MKISTIVAIAVVAAVTNAQQTCWNQLKSCKNEIVDKEIEAAECQDAYQQCQVDKGQCQAEKGRDSEQARCWKCAYTEVRRCVDATSAGYPNVWEVCYNNALNKHYSNCMKGWQCGAELHYRFRQQDDE
ncbi:hypothetical protein MVEG_12107 [Podila verticillata NRRL 6337]|uniref:Uncharacterized protein n=1 Tax=Podila verticillata NRRL 6337 TaxID=1069443 RepID=A0A086TJ26_9FUNG|nr:hypothetical protein MVEG_12107 [Podila verticillata NRRL 6337]